MDSIFYDYFSSKDIKLRNQIAVSNIGLVRKCCHSMRKNTLEPFDDLVQVGFIGLIKAVEKYDPSVGTKFSTLAIPYINGALLHWLRDKKQLIRVPSSQQEIYQRIRKLCKQTGILYLDSAKKLGVDSQEAELLRHRMQEHYGEYNPESLQGIEETSTDDRQLATMKAVIAKLPDIDQKVLRLFFIENKTKKQIALELNTKLKIVTLTIADALTQSKLAIAGRGQCVFCQSFSTKKQGIRRGKQYYKCNKCLRKFTTGKPAGRPYSYPKETIDKCLDLYYQGFSGQKVAYLTGVKSTNIYWWVKTISPTKEQQANLQQIRDARRLKRNKENSMASNEASFYD